MLWRTGHKNDPAGFVPRSFCRWLNRWDDPEQEFRTNYAAEEPGTALVEVFQAYAPSVIAQTTRGRLYPSPYLYPSPDLLPGREHLKALLGPSKWEWRALVAVEVEAECSTAWHSRPLKSHREHGFRSFVSRLSIADISQARGRAGRRSGRHRRTSSPELVLAHIRSSVPLLAGACAQCYVSCVSHHREPWRRHEPVIADHDPVLLRRGLCVTDPSYRGGHWRPVNLQH